MDWAKSSLQPRPANPDNSYVRAFLWLRAAIGIIGLSLPIVLLIGDGVVLDGGILPRGSLSAYYHSGMRDFFVGALCAVGVFLVAYKVSERTAENHLSLLAGVAAVGVALLPTGLPSGRDVELTPLQEAWGETLVARLHFASAAVFILALAVICYFFGAREGQRTQQRRGHDARFSPVAWRRFHWICAMSIVGAVVFIIVTWLGGWVERRLLIGETVAVVAFGASWLAKGSEIKDKRGLPNPPGATLTGGQ